MRARLRRLAYSPYAPRLIAEKITELIALALAAGAVWLCFGGPVSYAYFQLIALAAHAAGTVA